MFSYLVLFLRQYSLQRTIVRAEDVEKASAGIPAEPENREDHSEERATKNDNGDDDIKTTTVVDIDEKRSLEGHDVTETR